jgi:hypothetical protein
MTTGGLFDVATPTAGNGTPNDAQAVPKRPVADADVEHFLNLGYGIVGRTVSTKSEPNTSSRFVFWVADRTKSGSGKGDPDGSGLEIGNIVAAKDDTGADVTFGTVIEMRAYSDVESFIADYLSHNFGDASIEIPTDVASVVVVTCDIMRNLSGKTKPLGSSQVFFPSKLGIHFAYGIVDADGKQVFTGAAIPIGLFENGDGTVASVSVDEDFLVGPEGAHLNVSGISGLASKTSAVEFIVKSLLTHTRKRLAVVMFNVKSRDLLYVDRPNPRATTDDWSFKAYTDLGIPPEPFASARFFAPGKPTSPTATQSLRSLPVERFTWDLQRIKNDIPSLFDSEDWDDKMEGVWFRIADHIEQAQLNSYAQMLTWIESVINTAGQNQYPQGHHIATWNKMRSRLSRFPKAYSGLIATAGQGTDIPWKKIVTGDVFVVDIQMLADRGKKLVFSRGIREISELMEDEKTKLDAVIVFVDELNKFAPSGSSRTPLKSRLVDITARGRSIGLVLFGAEQFASSVEKEIVENSSTYLFGRTEANELRAPNYSAFTDEVKAKLSMLPQGRLLAKSAKYPQPVFLRFPFPPCLPGDQYEEPE